MKLWPALALALLVLTGCSEKAPEKKGAPPTLITVTQVQPTRLELVEHTLGNLEAVLDPKVGAEIAGRIIAVHVHGGQPVKKGQVMARIDPLDASQQVAADRAESARLEALLAQQERLVARQRELVERNFISRNALDDVTAQRDALRSQLDAAQARNEISRHGLGRTEVIAPFDGNVEVQIVSVGDYVKVGDPVFRLISNARLRANLPFPESIGPRLRIGLPVRLTSPLAPDAPVEGEIEDIRPTVLEGSRAIEVIARITNPGALRGGGSVDAAIITGSREGALVVPEQSVVLRPAGKVVYVVEEGKVRQQIVETGSKQGGVVEIVKGLQGGETIALDGAGFLTQGAAITVKGAPPAPGAGTPRTP
ncbi:MAG: efflux RND transporter periplasmic adaptor subunit [Azonexus sp.]